MPDQQYTTYSYRCQNRGVIARYVYDDAPEYTYLNLDNVMSRAENSMASRYGLFPITTDRTNNFPLGGPVQSLGKMNGIGQFYRYGSAGGSLYRRAGGTQGAYTSIANSLSGGQCSMAPYRPAASSLPYQFIADDFVMLKDNGSFAAAQNWGIPAPQIPCNLLATSPELTAIESFDESNVTSFAISGVSGAAITNRVSGGLDGVITPGLQTVAIGVSIIDTYSRTSGVMTIHTPLTHNLKTGTRVFISGLPDPAGNVSSVIVTVIDAHTFTYPNAGPNVSGTATTAFVCTAPSYQVGMLINIEDASPETVLVNEVVPNSSSTFTVFGITIPGIVANFVNNHINPVVSASNITGSVAANSTSTISKAVKLNLGSVGSIATGPDDIIEFWVQAVNPQAILQFIITFDVGDGSFTQDYYTKAVVPAAWQSLVSGTAPATSAQSQSVAGRASGGIDVRQIGVDSPSLLPTDMPVLQSIQPSQMNSGANAWTSVVVRLGEFLSVGAAGNLGNNWSNVVAWQITIQTQPNLATAIGVDDLILLGGADLDSFAGQPYDYRYTYYNINTGCESTPSVEMVTQNFLAVQRQAIAVSYSNTPNPADSQITHVRIYRRGGSLTNAWYYVAQVPIAVSTAYIDTVADAVILNNPTLNIDADAPVTTLLPTPLNATIAATTYTPPPPFIANFLTLDANYSSQLFVGQLLTVGTGADIEQCYVINVAVVSGKSVIHVYLQNAHPVGEMVTATTRPRTPMNLFTIAFDQAFLAGDANNPHILYYSTTYNPETFPQENFIEVGTPDSPIMALVVLRGFLYVFTTKTVYQIFGGQGSTPVAVPTGVMHGLVSSFGWAASENIIYYASYDGIYAFQGSGSAYMTQPTEWIWTGKNLGPIPAIGSGQLSTIVMAYANHEVFVSYVDGNGNRHRQIYSDVYTRWRNDDLQSGNITAMFFEQDTGLFVVGVDTGMVYQDLVNDYDSGGYSGGNEIKNAINVNFQTTQLDQGVAKAFKNYNEVTIDCTLNGQTLNVFVLFDGGATVVPLGTITGTGRGQIQLNINNGDGQLSLNCGLKITGAVTSVVVIHELHIRALVEAEYRKSTDSYWLGSGVDDWKMIKEVFAEYAAPDPAGVTFSAYTDGNMATPRFTFTLPQSASRISRKIRFPATKYKLIRFVGTSASNFQLYQDTELSVKFLGKNRGYERQKLSTTTTV